MIAEAANFGAGMALAALLSFSILVLVVLFGRRVSGGRSNAKPPRGAGALGSRRFSRCRHGMGGGSASGIPMSGQMKNTNTAVTAISMMVAGMPTLKNSPEVNCPLP